MTRLTHIVLAEPVIHGVLKLAFDDGSEGVVDLRPLIAKGKVFTWIETPAHFAALRIDDHGHSVSWADATGYVIDLSADSLRRDAERQADVHRLIVGRGRRSGRRIADNDFARCGGAGAE